MIWGDEHAWNWAHHTYSTQQIQEIIKTSKTLDAKTAVFFAYIYNVPQKEVQCLRRQSLLKILRSLTYFADADTDVSVNLLKPLDWEKVKAFFIHQIQEYTVKRLV